MEVRLQAQEAQMMHNETLVKKVKGKEDKMVGRASKGRNAAVLGYSQVEASDESNEHFASAIFDMDAPGGAGVPTIVQLNEYDTNKVEGMEPISALVLEALEACEAGDALGERSETVPPGLQHLEFGQRADDRLDLEVLLWRARVRHDESGSRKQQQRNQSGDTELGKLRPGGHRRIPQLP